MPKTARGRHPNAPCCFYDCTSSPSLGGDQWVVHHPFTARFGKPELQVKVHLGFLLDREKLPLTLRYFLPVWTGLGRASILYRYLLESGFARNEQGIPVRLTKRDVHKAVLGVVDENGGVSSFGRFAIALAFYFQEWRGKHYKLKTIPITKIDEELRLENILQRSKARPIK